MTKQREYEVRPDGPIVELFSLSPFANTTQTEYMGTLFKYTKASFSYGFLFDDNIHTNTTRFV